MGMSIMADAVAGSFALAMCQVETAPWDVEGNLSRGLAALDEAAGAGAAIAVMPECLIHGYAEGGGDGFADRLLAVAEPVDGPSVTALRDKAREHRMEVVFGFAELGGRDEGDSVHNTAVLVDSAGEIALRYRKVHCRPFESVHHQGRFVPGDGFEVSKRVLGGVEVKLGIMICFDREVTETVRCLRALGAEFIACPLACDTASCTEPSEFCHNEMITRVRAAENEVAIAVVNHASRFNGGSFCVGPKGEVIGQMGEAAAVETVEVDVSQIRDEFQAKPLGWLGWGHRRPDVYDEYIGGGKS